MSTSVTASTTGYYVVTKRPQNASIAAGLVRRQFTAPSVGSERCFVSTVAGTTANTTDATWTITQGAKTTDGTVTWVECTGQPGTSTATSQTARIWTAAKNTSISVGQVIVRNNGVSLQICTTAGATGNGARTIFQ